MKSNIRELDIDCDILRSRLALVILNSTSASIYELRHETRISEFMGMFMRNKEVIKIMIFNNDYYRIAPIHTLTDYYSDYEGIKDMTNFEKRNLGDIVTKLFINVLGYQNSFRKSRKYGQVNVGMCFYNEED